VIEPLREIDELVEFDGRWAGTDAERRAARHLAERLRALGRDAEIEPTRVRPGYPLAHLFHALLGIAGSVVSVYSPLVGVVLVLVAAVSTFGDLSGSFFLARLLTPVRASQNVVSREEGHGRLGLLVLTAHYDAARTGAIFNRRWLERSAALSKAIRRPVGPFGVFFWSLVLIAACTLVRLVGIDNLPLAVVQFIPTVILILSVPLLADIALSGVVPGANDNASGVATVLRLAERYGGSLEHFRLMVVLTGAEEPFMLGMRSWLKRHREELDPTTTVFLNVDSVGQGTPRWHSASGFIFPLAFHPTLTGLCAELAEEHHARGVKRRTPTDAYAARAAGFPAISIGCLNAMDYVPTKHNWDDTPENLDPDSLDRAYFFCADLIELIDQRVGADLAGPGEETALSEEETV
jgi:peptidase M28-like protein